MSTPSSTRLWNGSTGSITAGCSSRSATCRRRNSRRRTISQRVSCRWQPDSNPELPGKSGAVHDIVAVNQWIKSLPAADFQLTEDIVQVRLHSQETDAKLRGDLLVAQTGFQQLHDLAF